MHLKKPKNQELHSGLLTSYLFFLEKYHVSVPMLKRKKKKVNLIGDTLFNPVSKHLTLAFLFLHLFKNILLAKQRENPNFRIH